MTKKKIMPAPAIVPPPGAGARPRPWRIVADETGTPRTDLVHRIMYVPTGTSEHDVGARAHEMLHAAFTPRRRPESEQTDEFNAAEDGRVESLATARGIERPAALTPDQVGDALEAAEWRGQLRLAALSTVGSPLEADVRRLLTSRADARAAEAIQTMDDAARAFAEDPSYESTRRVVGMLNVPPAGRNSDDSHAPPRMPPPPGTPGRPGAGKRRTGPPPPIMSSPHAAPKPAPAPRRHDEPRAPAPTPEQNRQDGIVPVPDPNTIGHMADRPHDSLNPYNDDSYSGWARAVVQTPARPVRLAEKGHGHKGPADEGNVPALWHRLPVDQRVFRARRHTRRGTVLVDMSGSMSLDASDVERLITTVPAAVIAGYWGNGARPGIIRVLAAGGRRVRLEDLDPTGGENAIDGPALEWLARQAAPRVWVADGGITGIYDSAPTEAMRDQVANIIRRARIATVNPRTRAGRDWVSAALARI